MDIKSGAPGQPGATQREHDGVSHATEKMLTVSEANARVNGRPRLFTHSELTTLLERMARLVVQEAVARFQDEYCKHDSPGIGTFRALEAMKIIANDKAKLQQLREAVERG